MKLVVAGSTGFVATEVIRQALSIPAITSAVALGRRDVPAPENSGPATDGAKLKSVVCENWEEYSDSVKQELAGADACIWTIAITPSKPKTAPWETVCKVCRDYAVTGIETMSQLRGRNSDTDKQPFRFVYISGTASQRDPAQKPRLLGDYSLLRGEAETRILDFAAKSQGAVAACVAKPGIISSPAKPTPLMRQAFYAVIGLPKLQVAEIAAALLDQVARGFDKDTLENADLERIGQKALQEAAADA
ncbi:hypothetical protein B0T24DRAFT_660570 [Lasiosphaeria ovina]|uniref:NAD(P)-binding domain-containing protein n=1 Tax=Lasiosphaeria ovina TaxID=92902 RepID=A0AAE0MY27_9PEZI|nr:hypothetical protein B0T24DRAFT_660570 [Lasiosphaeria ovina]